MSEKKCCKLAEIAGFARMCGKLSFVGGGKVSLKLTSENPAIARHFKLLLKDYFAAESVIEIGRDSSPKHRKIYMLKLTDDEDSRTAENILRESGILLVRSGFDSISDGILESLIKQKCCRKAYLRGAFLGSGSMSDPEKSYHLEFVCSGEELASDLKKLINGFVGLNAKISERHGSYIVYLKDAEQIGDMLNIMKAHKAFFALQNIRLTKEMRNITNRLSNCDSANSDKLVSAAQRQVAAIHRIEDKRGLGSLPEKLREIARLRLENPFLGLTELAELCEPKLTKSGVNGRLRRIEEIAEKL